MATTFSLKQGETWLGQAEAELQICLLMLQKNYVGKFSAEKVEQIMFKYP